MDTNHIVNIIKNRHSDCRAIYLFGSRAVGEAGYDSDVDLAVLMDSPLAPHSLVALREELEQAMRLDVDLVDLLTASTVLRHQVVTTSTPLYRDSTVSGFFEAHSLSDYARLNDERAGILRDIIVGEACMVDDVALNKVAIIERCLTRIDEEYTGREVQLASDFTRQDAIVLNLLRACEASIDLAMHRVRQHQLGIPQSSRDAFSLLAEGGLIPSALSSRMQRMVGFRNVAVHSYRDMDLRILEQILQERLDDFRTFGETLLKAASR